MDYDMLMLGFMLEAVSSPRLLPISRTALLTTTHGGTPSQLDRNALAIFTKHSDAKVERL